jgi:hypothetical protein
MAAAFDFIGRAELPYFENLQLLSVPDSTSDPGPFVFGPMRRPRRLIRYFCDCIAYDVFDIPPHQSLGAGDAAADHDLASECVNMICTEMTAPVGLIDLKQRTVPAGRAVASGCKLSWQIDPISYYRELNQCLNAVLPIANGFASELRQIVVNYISTY